MRLLDLLVDLPAGLRRAVVPEFARMPAFQVLVHQLFWVDHRLVVEGFFDGFGGRFGWLLVFFVLRELRLLLWKNWL